MQQHKSKCLRTNLLEPIPIFVSKRYTIILECPLVDLHYYKSTPICQHSESHIPQLFSNLGDALAWDGLTGIQCLSLGIYTLRFRNESQRSVTQRRPNSAGAHERL